MPVCPILYRDSMDRQRCIVHDLLFLKHVTEASLQLSQDKFPFFLTQLTQDVFQLFFGLHQFGDRFVLLV